MNSDAGELEDEEVDTKFVINKKTKNDTAEQNKVAIDKKALNGVNGKILGKLITPSFKDSDYGNRNKPMKLGNNAKKREKMLANMGSFAQSKVYCGNYTTNSNYFSLQLILVSSLFSMFFLKFCKFSSKSSRIFAVSVFLLTLLNSSMASILLLLSMRWLAYLLSKLPIWKKLCFSANSTTLSH
jgi:hypothetical protein